MRFADGLCKLLSLTNRRDMEGTFTISAMADWLDERQTALVR
jgi:hypothetical protein